MYGFLTCFSTFCLLTFYRRTHNDKRTNILALYYTTAAPKKQPPLSSNCRPDCAIPAPYQFRILTPMMIEGITLERERDTADRSGGERCRIRSTNSLTEHRKPEQRDKLRRKNMRHSATKITSIVFCAAQRAKIPNACWGHPKPRSLRSRQREVG